MWSFLSDFYYTNSLIVLFVFLLLILGSKYYYSLSNLRVLFWYCLIAFCQFLTASLYQMNNEDDYSLINFSINIFVLFEYLIFVYFIYINTRSINIKGFIILASLLYVIYALKLWITDGQIYEHPTFLSLIESFLIISFSLFFFYETFLKKLEGDILITESFWVIFSFFLLFSIMTPFLLLIEFYPQLIFREIYTINNISYLIFYIFLSYVIICKVKYIT